MKVTVVVLMAVLLAGSSAQAQCKDDRECKGSRVCKKRKCVDPACKVDKDCPGEQICTEGTCKDRDTKATVAPPGAEASAAAQEQSISLANNGQTVPLDFVAPEGYTVRTVAPSGKASECVTPCTLRVNPGAVHANVVGYFDQTVQVSKQGARSRIALRKTGWVVTGTILAVTGLAQGIYGAVWWAGDPKNGEGRAIAQANALTGFAVAGVGLTALVIGLRSGNEIVVEADRVSTSGPHSVWTRVAFGVAPRSGGGLAQAAVRF